LVKTPLEALVNQPGTTVKVDRDTHEPNTVELEELEQVIESVCAALGVELVQVRVAHERGASILRVMIDRRGATSEGPADGSGITLADCTRVSRDISAALDERDYGKDRYHLEVGSPGLDRPLVKRQDFERFAGREVKVKTSKPIDGRRTFAGTLAGVAGDLVRVAVDGTTYDIPFGEIAKANLVHRF
jgi:ribosome maturation factor RimP